MSRTKAPDLLSFALLSCGTIASALSRSSQCHSARSVVLYNSYVKKTSKDNLDQSIFGVK